MSVTSINKHFMLKLGDDRRFIQNMTIDTDNTNRILANNID